MPIQVSDIPIPDRSTLAFDSPEALRLRILKELNELYDIDAEESRGWSVDVRQRVVYHQGALRTIPNEYELTVKNQYVPTQSFFSIVSPGINETVLERAGHGQYLTRGQLYPATEYGIPWGAPKESDLAAGITRVSKAERPWESGVTAFAAKISTAFGRYLRYSREGERTPLNSVQEIYTWERGITNPEGIPREAPIPGGETQIQGRVAGSATYLGEIESERNKSRLMRQYEFLVAKGTDVGKAATALEEQARNRVTGWWKLLAGGAVKEPTATKALTFIPAGSAGTFSETGDVYGYTGKEEKQKYVEGLRQEAKLGIAVGEEGKQRLEPFPEEMLTTAKIGTRSGEAYRKGFLSDVIYATSDLPVQSGQAQIRLPAPVREYVTDQGGMLMGGFESAERYEIEAKTLADFVESPVQMRSRLLNMKLEQGKRYYFTNYPREYEEKGGERLAYTPGSQMEYITGYRAVLPARWRDQITEEDAAIHMQKLAEKGFTDISWGANENPLIFPEIYKGTAPSQKRYFKAQIDVPLAGIEYALKTEQGNLPYDVMVPMAKYADIAVESLLEGSEDPARLIAALFNTQPEVAGAILETRAANAPLTLEEIGKRSGIAPTGEEFLRHVTNRLLDYPDQEGLLREFGVGVVEGTAPVTQMTPQTYKEMRQMLMSQLYMSGQIGKTEAGEYDVRAAKPFLRQLRKNARYDKETGLYTLYAKQKWLRGKFLMGITPETSGVGTINDVLDYLQADRQAVGVRDWVQNMFPDMFPETPASYAAKKIAEAFEGSQATRPTRPTNAVQVTPEFAHRALMGTIAETNLRQGRGEEIDDIKRMGIISQQMRLAADIPGEAPEPLYAFGETGTQPQFVAAGGDIFRALESERHKLTEAGELDITSQAKVATRFNRYMTAMLKGAETGEGDFIARERFAEFQEKYIDSDLINKIKGGVMARAGGATLLGPREVFMSDQALRRNFTLQGGKGWGKEWRQYQGLMQDATSLLVRYPAPNVGTAGMAGSVQMARTITSRNPVGRQIMDLYRREGIMPPEIITSNFYGAGIGDADRDPYTNLPTVVKTRDKGWVRYQGTSGDVKEYMGWLRGLSGSMSRQEQEATFMQIFQSGAAKADPFSVSTMNWAANMMGMEETQARGILTENLFGKRLPGTGGRLGQSWGAPGDFARKHLESLKEWNIHKTIGMGRTYNVYRRLVGAALTQMGFPTDVIQRTADIGIAPYQREIDFETMGTFLEELVGTSGFVPAQTPEGEPTVQWGINTGSGEFFNWKTDVWDVNQQNMDYLTEVGAMALAGRQNIPSEWIAALTMNIPERPENATDEQYDELVRGRIGELTAKYEEIRNPEGLTPLNQLTKAEDISLRAAGMAQPISALRETGQIGAQSGMGLMALWRGVRNYFDKGDLVKQEQIRAGFKDKGIPFGKTNLGFEEARELTEPLDVLFSHLKKITGPKAIHKDLGALQRVFGAFNKLGIQNRPMVQNLYRVWGKAAGINVDKETGKFVMPELDVVKEVQNISRALWGGSENELTERLRSIRQWNMGTPLRASQLGYAEEYTGDPIYGEIGTRLHSYVTDELKYMKEQGIGLNIGGTEKPISEIEHQMTTKLMTGKFDVSVGEGGGEEIYDIKFTNPQETGKFIKQVTGYRHLRESEGVPVMGAGVLWGARDINLGIEQEELQAAGIAPDTPYEQIPEEVRHRIARRIIGGLELKEKWTPEQMGPKTLLTAVSEFMVGRNIPFGKDFAERYLAHRRELAANAPAVLAKRKQEQGTVIAREAAPAAAARQEAATAAQPSEPLATGGGGIVYRGGGTISVPEIPEGDTIPIYTYRGRGEARRQVKTGALGVRTESGILLAGLFGGTGGVQAPDERVTGGTFGEITTQLQERGQTTEIGDMEDALRLLPEEQRARYLEFVNQQSRNTRYWNILRKAKYNKQGLSTAWMLNRYDVETLAGRVGGREGEFTFEPGSALGAYRKLPQLLSGMFQGDAREAVAGAQSPEEAWMMAQTLAKEQNINIGKGVKNIPELWSAISGIKGLGGNYAQMAKSGPLLRELASSLPGGTMVLNMLKTLFTGSGEGTQAADTLNTANLPGTELSNMFATFSNIQSKTVGAGAGRAGALPVGEARADLVQRWLAQFNGMTDILEKQINVVSKYKDQQLNLNQVLEKGESLTDKHRTTFIKYQKAFEDAELSRDKAAEKLTRLAGWEAPVARRLTKEELASVLEKAPTEEVETAAEQYMTKAQATQLKQMQMTVAATQPGAAIPGEEGLSTTDMGRMARRMLGGFGLMYMRSIFGIATQPLQRGYQEALGYQQAAETAVGGAFGGVVPMINPEEYNARVAAMGGGVGWAGIRTAQANLFRKQPGLEAIGGGLEAGIAGFGATAWLASLLPETSALGTFLGSAAPVIGVGIGLGSMYAGAIGAASEPDRQALALYQKVLAGSMRTGPGVGGGQTVNPVGLLNAFDKNFMGLGLQTISGTAEKTMQNIGVFESMRKYQESGGTDLKGFLLKTGYSPQQANTYMAQYGQAQIGAYPNIAVEGLLGAQNLQQTLGMPLTYGAGGTYELLATGMAQGIPYQQTAMVAAQSSLRSYEEQKAAAAQMIQTWLRSGGLQMEQAGLITEGAQRLSSLGIMRPTPLAPIWEGGEERTDTWTVDVLRPTLGGVYKVPRTFTATEESKPWLREREAEFEEKVGELPTAAWEIWSARAKIAEQRRMMNLPYQAPQYEEYAKPWTQQMIVAAQQQIQLEAPKITAMAQMFQGFQQMGMPTAEIDMAKYQDWTLAMMQKGVSKQQEVSGVQAELAFRGMPQYKSEAWGQTLQRLWETNPAQSDVVMGMLSGNRQAFAAYYAQNPRAWAENMPLSFTGYGGAQIPAMAMGWTDYRETTGPGGEYGVTPTGMSWGRSSLAAPGFTSAQMANKLFGIGGGDWTKNPAYSQIGGFINALISGGTMGGETWQQGRQAYYAQAQAGLQMQQIALQMAFQTGVGIDKYAGTINPQTGAPFGFNTGKWSWNVPGVGGFTSQGGGMWGAEDAMRAMGYAQQEWGFGQQREQLAMNARFFQQNLGLNMQQSQMQRGWTREDWAYNDQMRGMQWGWRQEDFQENLRFMTGRDRRLAERQMRRETIMYGQEGEQIDRQKSRQEELWKLEDERFRIQQQQYQEQKKFQEEAIKIQEKFFNERRKLEEEQIKMSRAYMIEQMELQKKQAGLSAQQAIESAQIADAMLKISQLNETNMAAGGLWDAEAWTALLEIIAQINPALAEMLSGFLQMVKDADVGKGPPDQAPEGKPYQCSFCSKWFSSQAALNAHMASEHQKQHGGLIAHGESAIVGEAGAEIRIPYFTEQIVPLHKFDPYQHGMPVGAAKQQNAGPQMIHLTLNLANKLFKEFIIDVVDQELDT